MDFIDSIQQLATIIKKQVDHITTEEATKTSMIMPFIQALGYNIFDPTEVVPEYTADVGIKKGEKVDYAILQDGNPIILMECKWHGVNLDDVHKNQLFRYFTVTKARIGILTNGIVYRFYSDLDKENMMDDRPFLEIDLFNLNNIMVQELKRLTKSAFDLEKVLVKASDLKYTKAIRNLFNEQMINPGDDFIRFCLSHVYNGRITKTVKEQFSEVVRKAFSHFINEKINDRLKSALSHDSVSQDEGEETQAGSGEAPEETEETDTNKRAVETTEEEIEGYHIVKAILRKTVDPGRVVHRDTLSYMGILLDDNNRKPICRLHFNNPERRYLGLMDEDKNEERVAIERLEDIFEYADRLIETVGRYDKPAD